jgi:hypothetical protein
LLTEAIKSYLNQRSPREASLEAALSALQKYPGRDPGFERAIAAFVDAEARFEDPIEGKSLEGRFVGRQFQPAGPVQSKIRHELAKTGVLISKLPSLLWTAPNAIATNLPLDGCEIKKVVRHQNARFLYK